MLLKDNIKCYGKFRGIYHYIKDGYYVALTLVSPVLNTKARYRAAFGRKLDLNNPKTLNDKILWLKLNVYAKDPLVIKCADKYRVRDYVKSCGCGEILNKMIGAWDEPEEIPWDDLPNQFALKWNFGAGMNVICLDKNKMNKDEIISKMREWGNVKYWLSHSEMHYKHIKKKIICEELLNASEEER